MLAYNLLDAFGLLRHLVAGELFKAHYAHEVPVEAHFVSERISPLKHSKSDASVGHAQQREPLENNDDFLCFHITPQSYDTCVSESTEKSFKQISDLNFSPQFIFLVNARGINIDNPVLDNRLRAF